MMQRVVDGFRTRLFIGCGQFNILIRKTETGQNELMKGAA
jgi:hypothetical protein